MLPRLTRRQWLIAAVGSLPIMGWSLHQPAAAAARSGAALPIHANPHGLAYFSSDEAVFIDAAVDRLIPGDALGPGAAEVGVTDFLDQQLAGAFGRAVDWYMTGPWSDGLPQQGYQRQRTPAEVYRAAIAAIDEHAQSSWGKKFAALTGAEQDDLLHALEGDTLKLGNDVSGKTFFTLLWQNTQEGFFADPLYLGNRDFAGWKLIGYPGPRYNYVDAIRRFGQAYPLPTVGLLGRDPSRRTGSPL